MIKKRTELKKNKKNSAGGVDICVVTVVCASRYRPLRQADHSYRGILPSVSPCWRSSAKITTKPTKGYVERGWTKKK